MQIAVPELDMDVPTVTDLWKSANWGEREAFEMFGFNFVGHPCLKRLLTHHEFVGHPLRKDYPMHGGTMVHEHLRPHRGAERAALVP